MKFGAMLLLGLSLLVLTEHASAACISMPSLLKPDTRTTLAIRKKADGIQVQKLCPGVDYIVRLAFPEPRKFMISCSSGIIEALTGPCTNQTEKTTPAVTFELPLTLGCETSGSLFALKLASKIPGAASYLSKNISFPLNPVSACPKSRCNLQAGNSTSTITNLLSGIPLFDLFNKLGITMGFDANQVLNFDVSKLNKTIGPEAFLQVLMGMTQLKMVGAKTLLDPTMVLSLLSKLSGVVATNSTNSTSIVFYKECSKLLTLWPTYWGSTVTSTGLYTSQWAELVSQFIPMSGTVADNTATLKMLSSLVFASKNPADSMLNIMSGIGNIISEGDFSSTGTAAVSVTTWMSLLGSYTSFLALVSK